MDECFPGIAEIDGVKSIVVSRLIKKYNDIVLGNVTITIAVTQERPASLVRDTNEILLSHEDLEQSARLDQAGKSV